MSDRRTVLFLFALALTASGGLAAAQEPSSLPETNGEGRWVYASHPVLGETAHVVIGDRALGLACLPVDDSASGASVLVMRMSFGLVPSATLSDGAVSFYSRPFAFGGAATFEAVPAGFIARELDVCSQTLPLLSRSRELVFLEGELVSGDAGEGATVTLRRNGAETVLAGESDLQAASGRIVIPLRGSSRAIQRLEAACPAIGRTKAALCPGG
ncbi:hypothetical protein [Jiella marina]|uniref:hypothetical protein n=1 Tax=Jiella sp. LLJ827 TaxID=2917712 RepID=UPI002101B444|nr:hypothetical protein [Jiella sp. LLJ827]MCQ0987513.1 hypothetical protein [Jiella sp. LLJ827]